MEKVAERESVFERFMRQRPITYGVVLMTTLALLCGAVLGLAGVYLKTEPQKVDPNEIEPRELAILEAIMPAVREVIGMSRIIGERKIPYIVSLMIKRHGKIIDGHTIHEAITEIDNALAEYKPLCYMTNCVHPDILRKALSEPFNDTETVRERFKGIEANAACAEPEELDSAQKIITSSADELADSFMALNKVLPMKICGGCCGTNDSHIKKLAQCLG